MKWQWRMDALIRVSDAAKCYQGGRAAVGRVSVVVAPGEAVAVMGLSGSGKPALLNLIGGLDRPVSGVIAVAGQRIGTVSGTGPAKCWRRCAGMVFWFFRRLDDLTVAGNVLLAAMLRAPGPAGTVRRGDRHAPGRAGQACVGADEAGRVRLAGRPPGRCRPAGRPGCPGQQRRAGGREVHRRDIRSRGQRGRGG